MERLKDTETHETVGWYVKGHVDDLEEVDGTPIHTRFRNVPSSDSPTGREVREVDDEKPGSFPVTVVYTCTD